jgi:hypothetical protein
MEFLGLCKWCGCPICRDGPAAEWDGVWCNHEVIELDEEVIHIEDFE